MDVQLAETLPEGDLLLGGDVLVAEEDHQMIHQRLMDHVEGVGIQLLGEIDAEDFSPDFGGEGADFDVIAHA
jgi:hypothetical protein